MEKGKERIKQILGSVATTMISRDTYGWPPECSLFAYQPQSPMTSRQASIGIKKASTEDR